MKNKYLFLIGRTSFSGSLPKCWKVQKLPVIQLLCDHQFKKYTVELSMSNQKYNDNHQIIDSLLGWVKSGEIAIPEIQRPLGSMY